MKHDIIVIGGGAAGIMAALTAKTYGKDVAIIESNDRIAKKILITGNGRCNITNKRIDALINEYENLTAFEKDKYPLPYHSSNKNFFIPVLKSFTVKDTLNFFLSVGLPIIELEDGKMYPMSLQASSVIDILRMSLGERGIPVYNNQKVTSLKTSKNGFTAITKSSESEEIYQCNKIILCTGGKAAPTTGSDGYGYNLPVKLGHKLITPHPAIVQIKLDYKNLKALSGIKFDGFAEILVNEVSLRKEFGEILFTDYGISGPPILQLGRIASTSTSNNENVKLKINMLPQFTEEELDNFLENHKALFGDRSIIDSFIGVINKKMIPIVLKEAGVDDIHKPLYELTWKEKKELMRLLHNWEFIVSGTNPFSNAQTTAGGIDTKDIYPETLESKLCKNLYFAGEIVDVDGDCGGYNLQWAWSSGYIAAKSCCI